jgi:hypothetical protein
MRFIWQIFTVAILSSFLAKAVVAKEIDPKQENLYEECVLSKLGEAQTDSAFTFVKDVCRSKYPRLYLKDWEPSLVPENFDSSSVETDRYKIFIPVENAWSEDGNLVLEGTFPNYKSGYSIYVFGSGDSFEVGRKNQPRNSVCDGIRVKKLPKWMHWNRTYRDTPWLIEEPFYQFNLSTPD